MLLALVLYSLTLIPVSYAWGPITHVYLALQAEDSLPGDSELRGLLFEYEEDYVYGAVAPDIYVSQYFDEEGYKKHGRLHSWDTALLLLKEASSPEEKAFAVGYTIHLVSDVQAHNHYVPRQGIALGMTMRESHAAIESAVDDQISPGYKEILESYILLRSDKSIDLLQRVAGIPSLRRAEDDFRLQALIYGRSRLFENSTFYEVERLLGSGYQPYLNKTVDNILGFLQVLEGQGDQLYLAARRAERLGIIGLEDPKGEEAQRLADEKVLKGHWWDRLFARLSLWWESFKFKLRGE
jgi:hypothetical protein